MHPHSVTAIKTNYYVDDWLDRIYTEDDLIKLPEEVKYVYTKGGFHIVNGISHRRRSNRRSTTTYANAAFTFVIMKRVY